MVDAEKTKLVLLGYWACPFGQRCRIALAEKELAYDHQDGKLRNKSPVQLRALQSNSAHKKIPALIHDGKPICESLIIVQYLDQVWPDRAPLLPADPYARANALFWADFIDQKVYCSGSKIWKLKEAPATLEAAIVSEARNEAIVVLKLLETMLGDKKYFGDETFGFLDIALVPFVPWIRICEFFGGFNFKEQVPKLAAWVNRCMKRESVASTLSDPYDFWYINNFGNWLWG